MTDPEAFAHRLDQVVRQTVGDRLVGTYLHGSAALGGFVPGRSDIDLLVVVDGPVDGPGLGDALVAAAEPWPGRGIGDWNPQRRNGTVGLSRGTGREAG